jgi:hypothetical protein
MTQDSRSRRLPAALFSGAVALALTGAGARLVAASNDTKPPSVVVSRCTAKQPCLSVTNRGKGDAIGATSAVAIGVVGVTNNRSTKDKYGTDGVLGLDAATDGGQMNIGVQGVSGTSNGVEGVTNNPSLTSPFARAAVFGIDGSSDGGKRNWGTAGFSQNGTGILG